MKALPKMKPAESSRMKAICSHLMRSLQVPNDLVTHENVRFGTVDCADLACRHCILNKWTFVSKSVHLFRRMLDELSTLT